MLIPRQQEAAMSAQSGAVVEVKAHADFGLNDNIGCYNLHSAYNAAHAMLLVKLRQIINEIHVQLSKSDNNSIKTEK